MAGNFVRTEWSPDADDLKRYGEIMRCLNIVSVKVKKGEFQYLSDLWSVLDELWDEWRVRVKNKKVVTVMDEDLKQLEYLINQYFNNSIIEENFIILINGIRQVKRRLMRIRKNVGLAMQDKEEEEEESGRIV